MLTITKALGDTAKVFLNKHAGADYRKVATVTKRERSIWDDLMEIGQDIFDKIDDALNPEKRQPKPVRIPIPVRNNYPQRNPYDQE